MDVRDVVKAYYLLLKKGIKGEIYNICSGVPSKLSEIIEITSNLIKISVTTKISQALIRPNDNPIIIGDNSKLKEHTGWTNSYCLEQTITDTIKYWQGILKD
ncbi:MAG: GDP-mannose 4,6-dehydratase [Duncaniella sp.]|nr:GDP-mannose 4,6-dehydratase [Duncaniella sp.]